MTDTGSPYDKELTSDGIPAPQDTDSFHNHPEAQGNEEPGAAVPDSGSLPDEQKERTSAVSASPQEKTAVLSENAPLVSDDGQSDLEGCHRAIGVRLHKAGQVYFFPNDDLDAKIGSKVILELENGPSFGEVDSIVYGKKPWKPDAETPAGDGRILALATAEDIARHSQNKILAAESTAFCKTCIRQRGLDMKLVDVEVLHDRSKIIFFFTAPSRIDFRDLVKDLVRNYRTRIELRQIGVRHETQMIGGIGNCGMVCCCHKYLRKFAPVTIKMAKEQNLFLNPSKLSGMCGRLLCCLSFEQGNYEEFNRRCPKLGKRYDTVNGTVRVLRANMFSQSIIVQPESGEEIELSLEEWETREPKRAEGPAPDNQRPLPARRQESPKKPRPRDGYKKPDQDGELAAGDDQDRSATGARYPRHDRPRPRKNKRPAGSTE